ncbi:hypothetical protein PBS_33870 [Paraburkholderia sp. 2C]
MLAQDKQVLVHGLATDREVIRRERNDIALMRFNVFEQETADLLALWSDSRTHCAAL